MSNKNQNLPNKELNEKELQKVLKKLNTEAGKILSEIKGNSKVINEKVSKLENNIMSSVDKLEGIYNDLDQAEQEAEKDLDQSMNDYIDALSS